MNSMFELLMELPLFRGVSRARLSQIVGATKFHFLKYPDGETIIRAGEHCDHLTFVISGQVRASVTNTNGRFTVSQTLTAPAVIAPDFLFGMFTDYPCDVTALGSTGILKISKNDYIKILSSDQVFMFNYLNALSVNAQKAQEGILSLTTGDLDERLAFWITALTQPCATDITMTCRTRDFCIIFGIQRSACDNALADMKARGLIEYDNKQIRIIDRKEMLKLLVHNSETH
ncbi:MAG: Crp/Fnr family transcriptional regulator [Muribaculaceae bacterium]|nr:Crp/Fnr family transcriptional regulator [Muribaculaceae bacterium]